MLAEVQPHDPSKMPRILQLAKCISTMDDYSGATVIQDKRAKGDNELAFAAPILNRRVRGGKYAWREVNNETKQHHDARPKPGKPPNLNYTTFDA